MKGWSKKGILTAGVLFAFGFNAWAWMERWAPSFDAPPATVEELSPQSIRHFVTAALPDEGEFLAEYSQGGALDLNGDKIEDFVFIIPWMGNGLNGSGCDVHFIVSDGQGGRKETVLEGYGASLSDLVTVGGKVYLRHSAFFGPFEKSEHNHWVYQLFAFDASGEIRCANADVGATFPAATILYDNPKFKSVNLTAADLKRIATETKSETRVYF